MQPLVNVVVTCSKKKKFPGFDQILFQNLEAPNLETAVTKWVASLRKSCLPGCSALELYAGDHWSIVRELPQIAKSKGFRLQVWICSAGYGLIGLDSVVKPYSASFSGAASDFIGRLSSKDKCQRPLQLWWELLSGWEGPGTAPERSITQVAKAYPDSPLIIAISEPYLNALTPDIQWAATQVRSLESLTIVSVGTKSSSELSEFILPARVELQSFLGGARNSLNVRILRQIINESDLFAPNLTTLKNRWSELCLNSNEPMGNFRQRINDDEVTSFIRQGLTQHPKASHTGLLRRLRDSGHACEQSRFADLFRKAKEDNI